MTDFLTRVAQRALGLGPAIQPLVVSRYAPARLPMSEALESEPVSKLSAEADSRNVEGRPNVRSASLISNSGRQPVAEQSWAGQPDDPPLRGDLNSLSEHAESIGPTQGNEIQERRAVTKFEAAAPFEATPFGAEPPKTTNTSVTTAAAVKAEAPSLLGSNLLTSEQQTTSSLQESSGYSAAEESSIDHESLMSVEKTGEPRPRVMGEDPALQDSTGFSAAEESSIVDEGRVNVEGTGEPLRRERPASQDSTGHSAAEESSIVEAGMLTVESLEPSHRVLSGGIKRPAGNRPDDLTASPGLYQTEHDNPSLNTSHHSRQIPDTSDQGERNLQVDQSEDYTPEGELRSLSAPEKSRRQTDLFNEVFAQKPVSSLPSLQDERVESGPPVIRVSIGRVEVRAVTPPPPAVEPPPPAAPKLSLEEFLRQPNGRRP